MESVSVVVTDSGRALWMRAKHWRLPTPLIRFANAEGHDAEVVAALPHLHEAHVERARAEIHEVADVSVADHDDMEIRFRLFEGVRDEEGVS